MSFLQRNKCIAWATRPAAGSGRSEWHEARTAKVECGLAVREVPYGFDEK